MDEDRSTAKFVKSVLHLSIKRQRSFEFLAFLMGYLRLHLIRFSLKEKYEWIPGTDVFISLLFPRIVICLIKKHDQDSFLVISIAVFYD